MSDKEQLYYLIEHYLKGSYTATDFESQFHVIYREMDYNMLSAEEDKLMGELWDIGSRCSPYEEDHINFPGMYYTEKELREKAAEIWSKLKA